MIVTVAIVPFFALRAIALLVGGSKLRTLMFLRGSKEPMVEVARRPPGGPPRPLAP